MISTINLNTRNIDVTKLIFSKKIVTRNNIMRNYIKIISIININRKINRKIYALKLIT